MPWLILCPTCCVFSVYACLSLLRSTSLQFYSLSASSPFKAGDASLERTSARNACRLAVLTCLYHIISSTLVLAVISSIIIPEFSTRVSDIFSCCLTCRFAYGWTGALQTWNKSKIPIEIICFVNSATYTLQVPNVTRNKHVFQVCIETCYPNIECFHMTSRRPCWCPKPVLGEFNSFLMQMISFVPINLHRCWPREWKHSIEGHDSLRKELGDTVARLYVLPEAPICRGVVS